MRAKSHRHYWGVALLLLLAACAPLLGIGTTNPEDKNVPVRVVSMRALDDGEPGIRRAVVPSFWKADVRIPWNRRPGEIDKISADAFEEADRTQIDTLDRLARDTIAAAPAGRRVMLFVHGFRNDYEHSLFRAAQIAGDFDLKSAPVLFSWAADTRIFSYLHDRDSADFSDSALADTIKALVDRGADLQIVAHSLGTWLVLEALNELDASSSATLRSLSGVVLISPDIDLDLFESRASRLSYLPQPFVIYSTPGQLVFDLSTTLLTAGEPRLGGVFDPERLSGFPLTYVDTTAVSGSDIMDTHIALAASPEMIAAVNAMPDPDLSGFPVFAGTLPDVETRQIGQMTWVELPATLSAPN